jgi:hypothetical protein
MDIMTVKQISIFLENKSGRVTEVLETLGKEKIRIHAMTIADTSEFGILRMVTSNHEESYKLLKSRGFSVNLTDVITLSTPAEAGRFAEILQYFSHEGISIEYMYAFSIGKIAYLVIRTDDNAKVLEIIKQNKLQLVTYNDLRYL